MDEATPNSPMTPPDPDAELLAACGESLLEAARAGVPDWVRRTLGAHLTEAGIDPSSEDWVRRVEDAAAATTDEVLTRLAELMGRDIDDQRSTPLQILRDATAHANRVLESAGVAPVVRDEWERRSFPEDIYRLAPAALSDVDESLHEPGLLWGAAKAHAVLARRRAEGLI